jgi:hypothetical protein
MLGLMDYFAGAGASLAAGADGAAASLDGAVVAVGIARLSTTEVRLLFSISVRPTEVAKKIAAKIEVRRVKKFAPPELPKIVWEDPPRLAEISAPFPLWSRTIVIKRRQVMT